MLFFCLSLCGGLFLQPPSSLSSSSSSRSGNQLAGTYLGWFRWPGGVGQIDMRIIDKLQSIDRSIDGLQALLVQKKRSASQQGGVAAVCCLVAPRQPELRNSNWDRLGEDDTATGIGSWQPGSWQLVTGNVQSATCNLCNAQPVCNISCNCHFSSMASFIPPLAKCQVPFRPCLPLFILLFIAHRTWRTSSISTHTLHPMHPISRCKNNDRERSS